ESFNADELYAPKWLNAQFFAEVLAKYEKDPELKVIDVKMSPATAKGDHYASVMFRAKIDYTTQNGTFTKSLIIKTMPEEEGHKKGMLGNCKIFETEVGMYTKVLPMFEEILRKVGDETRLSVACLYHSLEPRKVLIFEDLLPDGYTVIRDRSATIDELKAAYSKLAKWHAASFKLQDENPDFLKEYSYGLMAMPNLLEDQFMKSGMRLFIHFLDKTPELAKYKSYFESIETIYIDRFSKVLEEYRVNRQAGGYYVLSHGDFHLRNMLFKHNKTNQQLEDCMLVDFQICNLCPITIDLIYSVYLLMGPNECRNSYKELFKFYYSELIETLKKIGFRRVLPSLDTIWEQVAQHKYYEYFLLTTFLPMLCGVRTNTVDPADILQNEDIRQSLYFTDEFINYAKVLLPRYEKLGYLNEK
ncbi:CG13659, partial [Drosophila busckii]